MRKFLTILLMSLVALTAYAQEEYATWSAYPLLILIDGLV